MSKNCKPGVRCGLTADRVTPEEMAAIEKGEDQAVGELLRGLPPEGGSASRRMLEALVRTAFQGGHVVTLAAVNHRLMQKGGAQ